VRRSGDLELERLPSLGTVGGRGGGGLLDLKREEGSIECRGRRAGNKTIGPLASFLLLLFFIIIVDFLIYLTVCLITKIKIISFILNICHLSLLYQL
jgi:hypothetical protein